MKKMQFSSSDFAENENLNNNNKIIKEKRKWAVETRARAICATRSNCLTQTNWYCMHTINVKRVCHSCEHIEPEWKCCDALLFTPSMSLLISILWYNMSCALNTATHCPQMHRPNIRALMHFSIMAKTRKKQHSSVFLRSEWMGLSTKWAPIENAGELLAWCIFVTQSYFLWIVLVHTKQKEIRLKYLRTCNNFHSNWIVVQGFVV